MSQIHIRAPFRGPAGYELLARDIIEELVRTGVTVALEEFVGWGPFEAGLRAEQHKVLSEGLATQLHPQPTAVTNLNICLPEQVKLQDNRRNILYTMFETDRIPGEWEPFLENVDEIIVPTDFNRWSFGRGAVHRSKISVCPIGFNPTRYNDQIEPLPLEFPGGKLADFPIRMLAVCEVTNRKNFWGLLHLFYKVAELVGPEKVCLLLKVGNYSQALPLEQKIKQFRDELITSGAIKDLPYNVFNYLPLLHDEAHGAFIRCGTHYLSTSFGEGWDLTAMQAAACGLHVFVPNHTAYSCWLPSNGVSFLPIAKRLAADQGGATARLYAGSDWYALDLFESIPMIADALKYPAMTEWRKGQLRHHMASLQWQNVIPQYIEALHL